MSNDDSRFDMDNGLIVDAHSHLDIFELADAAIRSDSETFSHQDRRWKVEVRVLGEKYEIFPERGLGE